MPRKLINFELDFMKKDIFPRFTVKQFDDVSFNIKPKNQGLDYDTTGMTGKIFVGVNNDMFMQTTGITVSSNNINVLLDKNMLQNRGRAYAEIELTDSNGTITSSSFIFNIDEKIGEGAKIPGGYEGFVAKYERLISEFKAQVNSTIDNCNTNINSTINNCNKAVDNKLNDVDNFIDNKILDIEKRFNTLTSSQQQESEVIDARDGEVSLKARLDRDLYKDGISLSDRIAAIEGLKDSQNMKYETDKGYLVCQETKNGVIDDLKLVGKTLIVNDENIEVEAGTEGAKLLSVGQDVDKIEVLSNNKNLFNGESHYEVVSKRLFHTQQINDLTEFTVSCESERKGSGTGKMWVFLSNVYKDGIYNHDTLYQQVVANGNGIEYNFSNSISIRNEKKYKYIYLTSGVSNVDGVVFKNIQIERGLSKTEYTPRQSDKKQILFYNSNGELEPIQELHEWDSIEKHSDNKWYYHKRSGKVVLNGSEFWQEGLSSQFTDTHMYFACNSFDSIMKDSSLISDKFENKPTWDILSRECIDSVTSMNKLRIRLAKSKLTTQDAQGFKQWLQENNVIVVYQLAQEEVYELAPLHLDSYANETLILCNSGAISPKMEFSITSHINELVKAYGERINLLEEKVYQYMVTQNRMQLASTYSTDSVTFKVDYFSLCGDEENYDEDLYNLILNNILVGKDNYDYDKMFTIILDYASWNQISWEQFDILVGLMDIQHNPPVEELPTEDIIEEDIIENEETPVE